MMTVNWTGILVAAFSGFVIGGLWYSPVGFGKTWQREAQLTDAQMAAGNPAKIFGLSFVLMVLAAFVFSMFLGTNPGVRFATGAGFAAGLFWVAASFGVNYLFERKGLKLFLINGAYHTVQFTAIGLALGLLT